jgi:hypothetical protein
VEAWYSRCSKTRCAPVRVMTDRRRTPRYVLATPLPGDVIPMRDVTVEQFSEGRAVVISPSAHQPDERLVIHMTTREGPRSHPATVVSSSPVSQGGALRFRIELRVEASGHPQRLSRDGRD